MTYIFGYVNCVIAIGPEIHTVIIHSSMKTTSDVARQTRKFYMQAN